MLEGALHTVRRRVGSGASWLTRIVVFGATGYTGRLIAERLVAQGVRPVLAGRSESRLVGSSPTALGGLEYARADAMRQNTVFDLVGSGRRARLDRRAVREVGPAGRARRRRRRAASYLDSTGEPRVHPPRLRGVRAAGARGRAPALLTAMGYDFAPGALAGALALEEAGADAVRVDVGYYALGGGPTSLSAGTRESLVGVTLGDGHAYRDGRVRDRAPGRAGALVQGRRQAARGDLGRRRRALRAAGGVSRACARSTSTSGWFGPLARPLQAGSFVGPFVRKRPAGARARCGSPASARSALVTGPEAGTTPGGRSWIAAEAYDAAGRRLSEVHLAGVDGYEFTAGFLAWAAQQRVVGRGRARAGRGVRARAAARGRRRRGAGPRAVNGKH